MGDHNHIDEFGEDVFTPLEQLITMVAVPMTLKAATELDLFGIIARAGQGRQLSAAQIAAELPTRKRPEAASMLDRILRLLASYSLLTCSLADDGASSKRLYGLAPLAKYLVPDEDGISMAPFIDLLLHDSTLRRWKKLKDVVIEGRGTFSVAHEETAYDHSSLEADRGFSEIINKAMLNCTTILLKNIFKSYNGFKAIRQLVDVGGGLGQTIRAIVSNNPSIKGVNFDLSSVIQHTTPYPGVVHVGGDMFETVPQGDAIILKSVLHNWSDELCLKLLKNCYVSLPETGKVIIVDGVLSNSPETSTAAKALSQMDLMMMTAFPLGKERTKEEFITLSKAVGFLDIIFFNTCICNYWIIELHKQPKNRLE